MIIRKITLRSIFNTSVLNYDVMKSFWLATFLLLVPIVAFTAEEDNMAGKKYWIKDGTLLTFYADCGNSELKVKNRQAFTIDRLGYTYNSGRRDAHVTMDNGAKACIDVRDLARKSHYLYTDDPNNRYKEKLDEFLKLGIKRGDSVWLKYPLNGQPSLSRVTVKDVEPNDTNFRVTFDKFEESFFDQTTFTDIFYLKNPEKSFSKKALKAIKSSKIYMGMTARDVRVSWGPPKKVNRTVGNWGTHEQWVYSENTYIYIENGKVTSWQD
ncbi:MAG: hypothetical protein ACYDHC_11060 [Desulfuromonadaceae bacterium]